MLHDHRLDVLSAPHALQCAQYRWHLSEDRNMDQQAGMVHPCCVFHGITLY